MICLIVLDFFNVYLILMKSYPILKSWEDSAVLSAIDEIH